jgi:hypothetical protein
MLSSNPHFESRGAQFLVRHYAGDVMYNVAGMTDKNKDTLIKDLLDLVGNSGNAFLQQLFPDRPDPNSKKRPPTQGDKIKVVALHGRKFACYLMRCIPRLPLELWSITSCVPNPRTSARSNPTRTAPLPNSMTKPSSTRLNTSVYRRTSASDAQASRIGTRSKRWWRGFTCFPRTRVMLESTRGREMLNRDARRS